MMPQKTYAVTLFTALLISILFYYLPDVDAIKGTGVKLTETNSKKICGDKLCTLIKIKEHNAFQQSRFNVGGVTQQSTEIPTIKVTNIRLTTFSLDGKTLESDWDTITNSEYYLPAFEVENKGSTQNITWKVGVIGEDGTTQYGKFSDLIGSDELKSYQYTTLVRLRQTIQYCISITGYDESGKELVNTNEPCFTPTKLVQTPCGNEEKLVRVNEHVCFKPTNLDIVVKDNPKISTLCAQPTFDKKYPIPLHNEVMPSEVSFGEKFSSIDQITIMRLFSKNDPLDPGETIRANFVGGKTNVGNSPAFFALTTMPHDSQTAPFLDGFQKDRLFADGKFTVERIMYCVDYTSEPSALIDINKDEVITICHEPAGYPLDKLSVEIKKTDLEKHLKHGDTVGPCVYPDQQRSWLICHVDPNTKNAQIIEVPDSQYRYSEFVTHFLGHGDSFADNQESPCYQQGQPMRDIVCHDADNPSTAKTMQMHANELDEHFSHGHTTMYGVCPNYAPAEPTPNPEGLREFEQTELKIQEIIKTSPPVWNFVSPTSMQKSKPIDGTPTGIITFGTLPNRVHGTPTVCAVEPSDDKIITDKKGMMNEIKSGVLEWEELLQSQEKDPSVWKIQYVEIPIENAANYDYNKCDITIKLKRQYESQTPTGYQHISGAYYSTGSSSAAAVEIYYQKYGLCVEARENTFQINYCYSDEQIPNQLLGGNIRHEMGHALGLGHYVSSDEHDNLLWTKKIPPSIMGKYPPIDIPRKIQQIDIDKVKEIYGDDGFAQILSGDSQIIAVKIPDWFKFNAKLYSKTQISDAQFANDIRDLHEAGIIRTLTTKTDDVSKQSAIIPNFVRTVMAWWSNDRISDNEVVASFEYLLSKNIMKVTSQFENTDREKIDVSNYLVWHSDSPLMTNSELTEFQNQAEMRGNKIEITKHYDQNSINFMTDLLTQSFQTNDLLETELINFSNEGEVPDPVLGPRETRAKWIMLYYESICHLSGQDLLDLMDAWIEALESLPDQHSRKHMLKETTKMVREAYASLSGHPHVYDEKAVKEGKELNEELDKRFNDERKKHQETKDLEAELNEIEDDLYKKTLLELKLRGYKHMFFLSFVNLHDIWRDDRGQHSKNYYNDLDLSPVDKWEEKMRKEGKNSGHSKHLTKEWAKTSEDIHNGRL